MQYSFFFCIYNACGLIVLKNKKHMKKALIVFIAFIIVSSFSSCRTSAGFSGNVPFKEARNYFFNNDASVPASPLITTRQEFDKLFGRSEEHTSELQSPDHL